MGVPQAKFHTPLARAGRTRHQKVTKSQSEGRGFTRPGTPTALQVRSDGAQLAIDRAG
jgi:hypothetical protein